MANAFNIAAVCNCKVKVGAFKLQPFSAWHLFVLQALNSPFITGGVIEPGDVTQLVLVCQDRYEDNLISLYRFIGSKLYRFYIGLKLFMYPTWYLAEQAVAYVNSFLQAPAIWQDADSSPSKLPLGLNIICTCVRHGITFAEAANLPFPLATALFAGFAEANGAEIAEKDIEEFEEVLRRKRN